jgi:hypothetical protein
MFAGLFIIVAGAERSLLTRRSHISCGPPAARSLADAERFDRTPIQSDQ